MQEYRDSADRMVLIAGDEIGADILLADIELGLACESPVPLARARVGEEDQLETGRLDQSFLERADNVVVAGGDGQSQLGHFCKSYEDVAELALNPSASGCSRARRGARSR